MGRGLPLLVVVGCGRLHFDAVTDAAQPPDVPVVELCNGIDDNHDGVIDEGCPCIPFDVTVNDTVRGGESAVWTGAEVDLVTSDTNLHIDRVRDGMLLAPVDLGGVATAAYSVAWTGTTIAIVWDDSVNLFVTTYAPDTGVVGPTTPIGAGQLVARIAWAGDRLVATWLSGGNLFLRELDPTGVPLGPALMVAMTPQTSLDVAIATEQSYWIGLSSPPTSYGIMVVDRQTHAPTTVTSDLGSGAYVRLREEPAGIVATLGAPSGAAKLQMFTRGGMPLGAGVALPSGPSGAFGGLGLVGSSSSAQLIGFTSGATHDVMAVSFDPGMQSFGPVTVVGSFSSGAYGTIPTCFGSEGRVGIAEFYLTVTLVLQRCR